MTQTARTRLSFLPIPALILLTAIIYSAVNPSVYFEPEWLLPVTNTLFVFAICFAVAWIAQANYRATGRIQILLLGCGLLPFGIGGLLAAFVRFVPDGANLNVTIYNTGALLGAMFHFAAAIMLLSGISPEVGSKRKGFWLTAGYAGVTLFMALLTLGSLTNVIPPFFIQQVGPTLLRQRVLGAADILFAFSSVVFMATYLRNREAFIYWYSCALALTSISLTAFLIENSVGSPLGWTGRFSQYFGGVYFLIALITAVRSARARRTSLGQVLTVSLSAAEEKFRALAENSPDIIIRFDRDMRHVYINPAGLRLYGKPAGAIIGNTMQAAGLPQAYGDLWEEKIRQVLGGGQPVLAEGYLPAETGPAFYQSRCVPEYGADGSVANVLVVSHDLTDRRRAEEELREVLGSLESHVRERTAELQQANELLKQENEDRLRSEQSLRLERARLDALLGLSQMSEASIGQMAGFILEHSIALTGSKIGFVGFLNEDESVYTLHAVSKDVVKECDVTGNPLQWHVAGAGIWADAIRQRQTLFINDYSQPHPSKKGLPPGHPPVQRFMVVPMLDGKRIVAIAGVGNKASDYERADERQIALLLTGMWNYVQRDRAREALQQAHDELEQRVQQRTAELAASNAALQEDIAQRKRTEKELSAAKAALEEASVAKDQFIAKLSHELRTPLTPVVASLSALARDLRLPEDLREDIDLVERNIALEVHLINDLLDVTRIVSGKLALSRQPVDLVDVLRDVGRIVAADLDARSQTLTIDAPHSPCWVDADRARLHQVFWNLTKNAIKFSPERSRIAVEMSAAGGSVRVTVNDSGMGIDPSNLPRLFRAFEQGASGSRFGGLGLGLAICKGIVDLHGGTISAVSNGLGKGAAFTVGLPLLEAAPESAATSPAAGPEAPRRSLHILLVEDHEDSAKVMRRLLMAEDHQVTWAASVQAALAAARAETFDVLVSDLGLPDGTGYDLMRRLLATGKRLKGIAISGYGAAEDVQRSLAAGFLEHITKPIAVDALRNALMRVANAAAPSAAG